MSSKVENCFKCGGSVTETTHPTLGCKSYYCDKCKIYWVLAGDI